MGGKSKERDGQSTLGEAVGMPLFLPPQPLDGALCTNPCFSLPVSLLPTCLELSKSLR